MADEYTIDGGTAVSLFAAHMAASIRAAASACRQQREVSTRYERARHISERITKGMVKEPPMAPGDDSQAGQALLDVQALADALRHIPWLCDGDPQERLSAVEHHRQVVAVLQRRFGDRAAKYHFDEHYLRRCLEVVANDRGN